MPDKDSLHFIDWVKSWFKQNASDLHTNLGRGIAEDFEQFYLKTPNRTILNRLVDKLTRGALEHGPLKNEIYIKKELEYEYLDLIGWSLMRKYLRDKKVGVESGDDRTR